MTTCLRQIALRRCTPCTTSAATSSSTSMIRRQLSMLLMKSSALPKCSTPTTATHTTRQQACNTMLSSAPHRMMSGGNFLSEEEVMQRVIFILSKINKIHDNPEVLRTLGVDSTFESLGLDSLDQVEVVMQLEEEFYVDINDDDAVRLTSVKDCIKLFSNFPFAVPIRGGFH